MVRIHAREGAVGAGREDVDCCPHVIHRGAVNVCHILCRDTQTLRCTLHVHAMMFKTLDKVLPPVRAAP